MWKNIFTKEFSNLHVKYGMVQRVDMHVKVVATKWYCNCT